MHVPPSAPEAVAHDTVLISEVGPRDGLQSVQATMPTADKLRWIDALVAAGLREIEVGSFVPARLLPQMADVADVVRHALTRPGITVMALAPNLRGAQAAMAAGVHKVTLPVSASAAHSLANVRKTREAMVEEVRAVARWRHDSAPGVRVEVGLSTAFGCTLQGSVPEDDVIWLAGLCADAGADEIGLSDTTGMANPAQVRAACAGLAQRWPGVELALHLHDTRGMGLANVLAGLDAGIAHFDASLGGLGGCPFAPGASGNICTEDLVHMLEAIGCTTGVDLDALIACAQRLPALVGHDIHGQVWRAGPATRRHLLPRDFDEIAARARSRGDARYG